MIMRGQNASLAFCGMGLGGRKGNENLAGTCPSSRCSWKQGPGKGIQVFRQSLCLPTPCLFTGGRAGPRDFPARVSPPADTYPPIWNGPGVGHRGGPDCPPSPRFSFLEPVIWLGSWPDLGQIGTAAWGLLGPRSVLTLSYSGLPPGWTLAPRSSGPLCCPLAGPVPSLASTNLATSTPQAVASLGWVLPVCPHTRRQVGGQRSLAVVILLGREEHGS